MYKVLIIDDEKTIREGLKKVIKWDELGFDCVGCFESAEEAVDAIESGDIDVVITDVVMEGISGIDLINITSEKHPYIKFIVISGYDRFEYVRDALRLGAYDYLTKPIKLKELNLTLMKIKSLLDEENEQNINYRADLSFISVQLLNNLVKGFYGGVDEVADYIRRAAINLDAGYYYVLRIDVGDIDKNYIKDVVSKCIASAISEQEQSFVFNNDRNEIAVLLCLYNDKIGAILEQLSAGLDTLCYIGIGNRRGDIFEIKDAYTEAGIALKYRIIKPAGSILFYSNIADAMKRTSFVSEDVEKNMLQLLDAGEITGLTDYLEVELNCFNLDHGVDTKKAYDVFMEIILTVNKYITNNVAVNGEYQNSTFMAIKSLLYEDNYDSIKKNVFEYIAESIEIIKRSKDETNGRIIYNAKRYIDEHYNERITLEKLSHFVYVHPIYLSALFKEKTGENFIDYLTRVRIENAKRLLVSTAMKINDISYMVGYESSKHFSKVFKDATGMPPKEYRNNHKPC